ncbi:MAG: DHH family phosphoesterase [Gemmataceae bacterium]
MPVSLKPLADFLQGKSSILLTTHARADGDAIGSCLAMLELLQKLEKTVEIHLPTPFSQRYVFMDPEKILRVYGLDADPNKKWDGMIVLDTGTWSQLAEMGTWIKQQFIPTCVIDHHVTQDYIGNPLILDTSSEATGRLVFDCFNYFGVTPSPAAANYMFIALATDTGWFRHANTTASSYSLAGELVNLGATPTMLYDALFDSNSLAKQKLAGLMLSRCQTRQGGRVVYSWLTQTDFSNANARTSDAEDLIVFLRSTACADIVIFFLEINETTTRVNFRSRTGADVCQIAQQFGGGGHKLAAGATVQLPINQAIEKILIMGEGIVKTKSATRES